MIEKLHFITNDFERSHWENAELACKGGVKWVQLRVKNTDEEEWLRIAEKTQDVCVKYGATFIINDNVTLAQSIIADGVHLGLSDTSIDNARNQLGDSYIIGGSSNTLEDILLHHNSGADYVGLGPFTYTDTKKNLSPILGLSGIEKTVKMLRSQGIHIPVIAIGGIKLKDIKNIYTTGVQGIAISTLITSSKSPIKTTEEIIKMMEA